MADMVEVVIDSIRVGLMSQNRVVILREVDAERFLAIWIDSYMAEQITFALQEVEVARPMSHDLMRNLLQSLNARVIRVEVIELKSEVFYGNIVLETDGGHEINIDSRPSDALALAVRTNVPILVSHQVMEEAGIIPEEDLSEIEGEPTTETLGSEPSEGSEERLSVFKDFLQDIDIDAKGKGTENDEEDDK